MNNRSEYGCTHSGISILLREPGRKSFGDLEIGITGVVGSQ